MRSDNGRLQLIRSKQPSRLIRLIVASASVLGVGLTGCSQPSAQIGQAIESQPSPSASPQPSRSAIPFRERSAIADAEALVAIGPRVAGTPAVEQASRYLEEAFRQAGYVT
ncbi:MAG: hypothetical protein F6K28_58620, partial [Microcoleus sp. SIO2G3]|nr:hypothetical protein [Microcoleus sp. SIO2G3]